MADTAYDLFLQALLAGTYNLGSATVKLMLVHIGGGHYVPNFTTDQYITAIASGDQIAISPQLTSVTLTDGIFNAANTAFASVASGPAAGAFVIFIDTGTPSTSPLLVYIDSYSGLPVTPNGSNIDVTFTGSGIFILNG